LFLLILPFFLDIAVNPFENCEIFELIGGFGNEMAAELDGLAFGVFEWGLFPHDSL
jgi:hypothetical protein